MGWINGARKWSILLLVAGGLGAVAIVTAQNTLPVAMKFVVWRSIPLPLGLWLSLLLVAGFVAGGFFPLGKGR